MHIPERLSFDNYRIQCSHLSYGVCQQPATLVNENGSKRQNTKRESKTSFSQFTHTRVDDDVRTHIHIGARARARAQRVRIIFVAAVLPT